MLKRWFGSWFSSPVQEIVNFNNYIAVIIGASNPIGEAIATKCIADECINIAIVDMEQNKNSLYALQNKLKGQSHFENIKIESFCIQQLNNVNEINKLISNIKTVFNTNSIQFLFNNMDCLISSSYNNDNIPTILTSNSHNKNNAKFHQIMDFNFWNMLYVTRAFLPLLTSKENVETNKQCFIINTSSLKAASMPDTSYSVSKYCGHALSEIMKYEIDVMLESKKLQCIDNRNSDIFDLKVKILCPGFVENNDEYNVVNMLHKYDALESMENMKKIINKIEISIKEFGDVVFDAIRNDNIFIIQSHTKLFRIYSGDKLIAKAPKEKRHIYTKKMMKSILSKM
eukprot:374540_1